MPVLVAYAAGSMEERAFWERTVADNEQGPDDLHEALRLIERRGAIDTTLSRAGCFAQAAQAALAPFPDSALRRAFNDVADYTLSRAS